MASSLYRATVDFFFTIVWMSAASSTGVLVKLLLPFLGFDRSMFFPVLLGCIAIQIMIFGVLIAKLRGASFNPTTNLANFWAKEGFESAESLLYRVPAQTLGGLFGALLTWYITPEAYKPMLNGPHVKSHMTIASAAAIEFVLTLALSFIILCIVFKGPKAGPAKGALVAISTVTCIVLGAPHTGPSLNPIFAFGWAVIHKRKVLEHFIVYWLAPTAASILAGAIYYAIFKAAAKKDDKKKAE